MKIESPIHWKRGDRRRRIPDGGGTKKRNRGGGQEWGEKWKSRRARRCSDDIKITVPKGTASQVLGHARCCGCRSGRDSRVDAGVATDCLASAPVHTWRIASATRWEFSPLRSLRLAGTAFDGNIVRCQVFWVSSGSATFIYFFFPLLSFLPDYDFSPDAITPSSREKGILNFFLLFPYAFRVIFIYFSYIHFLTRCHCSSQYNPFKLNRMVRKRKTIGFLFPTRIRFTTSHLRISLKLS